MSAKALLGNMRFKDSFNLNVDIIRFSTHMIWIEGNSYPQETQCSGGEQTITIRCAKGCER